MPLVLITRTCSVSRNRFFLLLLSYLLMGDESGSATDIDRLLVFSGLSTPNFTFIGNDFLELSYGFLAKNIAKIGTFEFSWISRRCRVGFSKVFGPAYTLLCQGRCFQSQALSCSGWQNLYAAFRLAQFIGRAGFDFFVQFENAASCINARRHASSCQLSACCVVAPWSARTCFLGLCRADCALLCYVCGRCSTTICLYI